MASQRLYAEMEALLRKAGVPLVRDHVEIRKPAVLLVIDMEHDFLPGGSFGVAEGDETIEYIVSLIGEFAAQGNHVFCSRDIHPVDHCSFNTHGGPFPPHCVVGTHGCLLHPSIAAAIEPLMAKKKATVVYKGMWKESDSFGAFPYGEKAVALDSLPPRIAHTRGALCDITGAFVIKGVETETTPNPHPNLAQKRQDLVPLVELVPKGAQIFVCGLAFDFCVLDTAINAALCGFTDVNIILPGSRAAHITGVGKYGTGFLSDPAEIEAKLKAHGVHVLTHDAVRSRS